MPNPDIDSLILLYLRNEASELQKKELEQWINASQANRAIFNHIKKVWSKRVESRVNDKLKGKRDEIWTAGTNHSQKRLGTFTSNSKVDKNYWSKVSAIVLIVLVSFALVFQIIKSNKFSEAHKVPDAVVFIEKKNPAGQKSMHMLPDGTQVWLNAESILTYSETFSDTLRMVQLIGEAYFEVAHNPKKPFIVEVSETRTQALGTTFNIRAYPEDKNIKVALLDGKVKVHDLSKTYSSTLSPGEQLNISKDGTGFSKHLFNYEDAFGWKQGILIFDGVDFETFCSIVEKWYGVQVKVKGIPHSNWKLRARYKNESLHEILRDISFNKNFNFRINNKHVFITF